MPIGTSDGLYFDSESDFHAHSMGLLQIENLGQEGNIIPPIIGRAGVSDDQTQGTAPTKSPNTRVEETFKDLNTEDLLKHEEFDDNTSYLNRVNGEYVFGKLT